MTEIPYLVPGSTFADRYEIAEKIGEGGMGVVYRATDAVLGRHVAIKLLRTLVAERPVLAERLAREAQAMALVRHAGIVQVFDRALWRGLPYVVMELCHGEDLQVHLERVGVVALADALAIAQQLTDAIAAAHAAGVIHRDLKPSNVFLSTGTLVRTVKVLDFGLAKLSLATFSLTDTHQVFGTLLYMSPEQITDSKRASTATDVYAIGAMLYEMLAGAPPLTAPNRLALGFRVLNEPAPRLQEQDLAGCGQLSHLVARCLAKRASERPSAHELGEALRKLAKVARTDGTVRVLPPPRAIGTELERGVSCAAPHAATEPNGP